MSNPRTREERFVTKEILAAINATLNGTAAVLLVLAFVFIKRRQVRAHAWTMIAALATSAVFLVFYLTSWAVFGDRSSGLQSGTLKTFYLLLLASHVLLAVVMLPMIFLALLRAYNASGPAPQDRVAGVLHLVLRVGDRRRRLLDALPLFPGMAGVEYGSRVARRRAQGSAPGPGRGTLGRKQTVGVAHPTGDDRAKSTCLALLTLVLTFGASPRPRRPARTARTRSARPRPRTPGAGGPSAGCPAGSTPASTSCSTAFVGMLGFVGFTLYRGVRGTPLPRGFTPLPPSDSSTEGARRGTKRVTGTPVGSSVDSRSGLATTTTAAGGGISSLRPRPLSLAASKPPMSSSCLLCAPFVDHIPRSSTGSAGPTFWLFSGWNWVATTLSRQTLLTNGRP
jgi:putative membrane protein